MGIGLYLKNIVNGEMSMLDAAKAIAVDAISSEVSALNPVGKLLPELLLGRTVARGIDKTQQIRNKWEYAARVWGVDGLYKMLNNKRTHNFSPWELITNLDNSEESWYWWMRERRRDWDRQHGKASIEVIEPSATSSAMKMFRNALARNDVETAAQAQREYIIERAKENGGASHQEGNQPRDCTIPQDDVPHLRHVHETRRGI